MFLSRDIDLPPHIVLTESKRARRVALRLDTKERVFKLVVPKGMSLRKAVTFAEEHESWMQEKLAELPALVPFADGTAIPVFGEGVRINIDYDTALKRTSIELKENELYVHTYLDDPSMRIQRFLKTRARTALMDLTQEKAGQIGREASSISIRDTKSRWGSCAEDGSICYSWRLIFAPWEALDYVVAHEVAHLEHLDHSDRFWALCRKLSEDFLEGQYWIENHGNELMRYGSL